MIYNKSVVIFGKGDVLITPAINTKIGTSKIKFSELEEPLEIGTKMKYNELAAEYYPVELIFEKEESIDALIEGLRKCKEDMQKFKRGEYKNEQSE